ncbi:MAG: hypothetical protein RLY72_337, partial [Planctomycetota bacterium]
MMTPTFTPTFSPTMVLALLAGATTLSVAAPAISAGDMSDETARQIAELRASNEALA